MTNGDVVVLKSGGPPLTVAQITDVSGQPSAIVQWFLESGELKRDVFPMTSLKVVDE